MDSRIDSASAIIPVSGDSALFRECLEAVLGSDYPLAEVLVVDDSRKGIRLEGLPPLVRVIRAAGGSGPACARNLGAAAATGDLIVFTDSDVVIDRKTIASLAAAARGAGAAGAVALLSPEMRWKDFFSTYKNMFLHYSFARLEGSVPSFYTCCALVSRDAFRSVGGFDEEYLGPAIEDTDFGNRLNEAGARVVAGPRCLVEHVKRYTLGELLRLDFGRAAGLVRLFLRRRCLLPGRGNTSVPAGFIAGAPLSAGMLVSLLMFPALPAVACSVSFLVCFAASGLLNAGFIRDVGAHHGALRAVQTMFFIPVDQLVSMAGALWGAVTYFMGRRY